MRGEKIFSESNKGSQYTIANRTNCRAGL